MGMIIKDYTVTGNKGSATVRAVYDPHARDSLVRRDIAGLLGGLALMPTPPSHVRTSEGRKRLKVDNTISLIVAVGAYSLLRHFYVVEGLSDEIIIGQDMIRKYRMGLDFKNKKVAADPGAVERAFRINSPIFRLAEKTPGGSIY